MQAPLMEETRYWMWTRTKLSGSLYESWEEKAFAEDTAAHLGGSIWPPRSYSCNFCRREFRSAQALGGHMNVHRRDRARLRQSLSPRSESTDEQHLSNLNTVSNLQAQFTSQQVYAPICNAKPNPNPNSSALVSSHPVSRVFSASTKKSSILDTLISASYSSYTNPGSRIDSLHVPASTVPELKLGRESLKRKGEDYCGERGRFHDDEREEKEEEEEHLGKKRRRLNPVLPFFVKAAVDEQELLKSKVLELAHNNVEEIDLELRLGDRPKVKENSIDLS